MKEFSLSGIFDRIREELSRSGIDLDVACCDDDSNPNLRVVCMAGGLGDSIREMGKTTRDQVLMVRVDDETLRKLDAWVETGAFKSRSEAAALFIREGLKVHGRELDELAEALRGVESAKDNLRKKAREVFREEPSDSEAPTDADATNDGSV